MILLHPTLLLRDDNVSRHHLEVGVPKVDQFVQARVILFRKIYFIRETLHELSYVSDPGNM